MEKCRSAQLRETSAEYSKSWTERHRRTQTGCVRHWGGIPKQEGVWLGPAHMLQAWSQRTPPAGCYMYVQTLIIIDPASAYTEACVPRWAFIMLLSAWHSAAQPLCVCGVGGGWCSPSPGKQTEHGSSRMTGQQN